MVNRISLSITLFFIASLLILASSCAQYGSYVAPTSPALAPTLTPADIGFYHKVVPGDTLSGLSTKYNVPSKKISSANKLSSSVTIEPGQLLYIPLRPRSALLGVSSASATPVTRSVIERPTKLMDDHFIWPLRGKVITRFGMPKNDIISKGIDIAALHGLPVYAAGSGVVTFSDAEVSGMGKMIVIDHGDGMQTVYAHNAENLVKVGESVKQNDIIARVGSTGRAKEPFLHFEVRKDHRPVDPTQYLAA